MKRRACLLALPALLGAQVPREAPLRAHLAFLADDLLEGRGMGQRGGALAVRYLAAQLEALGLQPLPGGYLQPVLLDGILTPFSGCRVEVGAQALVLGTDVVVGPSAPAPRLEVDAPLVFVGHGVRDVDFRGLDPKGKVLVALVGPLPGVHEASPWQERYLARWPAKFEEAQRRGAAGILLVHQDGRAGYGWPVVREGWRKERFQLARAQASPAQLQGWLSEEAARRLFARAGLDLATLAAAADGPAFRPVETGLRLKASLASTLRRLTEHNVAAVLPGTDPALREEAVFYMAHWDHFGADPEHPGRFYNGAVDNASGCAGVLAIAEAARHRPAQRSQVFLFTTGEEHGLLGAYAWLEAPRWPLGKTRAVLNLESLNAFGATEDIGLAGSEEGGLRAPALAVARRLGLEAAPPRPDRGGLFFRADHFAFARAGIPAFSPGFSLDGGWRFRKDPAASQSRAAAFLARHYHQPSDRYDPAWDLEGMLQQVRFVFELGQELAAQAR